jgi:hypothetical protein
MEINEGLLKQQLTSQQIVCKNGITQKNEGC